MHVTIKDKTNAEDKVVFTQYENHFMGKPVYEKPILSAERLMVIDNVISKAYCDNPKTLVVSFQLLLPAGAQKQKRSTMNGSRLFKSFIRYLMPEVEAAIVGGNTYIPNSLRYIAVKSYVSKGTPYFSYRVALLVNNDIYEDVDVINTAINKCLMEKIVGAWVEATELEYYKIKKTFTEQDIFSLIIDNFSEDRKKQYDNAHYRLSILAGVGRGSYLYDKDAFSHSKD